MATQTDILVLKNMAIRSFTVEPWGPGLFVFFVVEEKGDVMAVGHLTMLIVISEDC